MSSNSDDRDRFDWDAYEAEVLDLDAARAHRHAGRADSGEDAGPVLVDTAEAQHTPRVSMAGLRAGRRRPILPGWLRSRQELRDTARWVAGHLAHTSAYHATRTPKYAGKLAARSPRGAARVVRTFTRWVFDLEGEQVRQATVRREDSDAYLKLSRQRDRRVRWRGMVALFSLGALLAAGVTVALMPAWLRYAALALLVTILGLVGRPADKPLLDTAVTVPRVARLTSDVVVRALSVLGIAGINQALAKNPKAISFPAPITRDGPGWRADVDLPYGVTAAEVIDRRDKLASGLGRPLGCVWPEGNHEISPGRLTIWVGDQDMASARQPAWPLARSGMVDLFKPIPFGTDPRGRAITGELLFTNWLIGSIPGYGKTFSLRLPLLAASLDVRAELWVYELKGTGDLEPLAKVAALYASGADDDTAEAALMALRELRKECAKRAATIKGLPKGVCPENKVTPELASRKSLGLHPLVVAIDECQELFSHKEYGDEAGEHAEKIIKLGRALGVTLLLATQRPDAKSLPTGVSANVGTRFCLKVMGQLENDMILGTSMYKNGIRATMFTKRDKGVGYLVGGDEPQITRTYYINSQQAEAITDRARALREKAGTLTGHAIGQQPDPARRLADTLLEDILTVVPVAEPKVWAETLTERLAGLRPEVYAEMSRDQLTAALKAHGIGTGQVWGTDPTTGKGANRRGIDRTAVAETFAERNRRRGNQAAG